MTIEEFNQVSMYLETLYNINLDEFLVKNVNMRKHKEIYSASIVLGEKRWIIINIPIADVNSFFEDGR